MQCIGLSLNPAGILSKYYLCSDQIQFSNVANCEVSTARKKATFCSISTEPPTSPLLSSLLLTAQVFTLTTYTFQNLPSNGLSETCHRCHNAAFNHSHSHTSDAIVAPYCTIAPILFVILHVSINYQLYVDGCITVDVVGRVG